MIDNTFASPVNQNPINHGIDIVIHSATKYLGGHSDISAGAVISTSVNIERILDSAKNFGGNLSDYTVWLLERSIKTLFIRVQAQNENALKIAERGYKFYPAGKYLKIGRMNYYHGHHFAGVQHTRNHLIRLGANVMYGHHHDLQQSSVTHIDGVKSAWSIGCLKDMSDEANAWDSRAYASEVSSRSPLAALLVQCRAGGVCERGRPQRNQSPTLKQDYVAAIGACPRKSTVSSPTA